MMKNKNLSFEFQRKVFHLCSIMLPLLYLFIQKIYMCAILFLITTFVLYLDIYRRRVAIIKYFVNTLFARFMRKAELDGSSMLTGASFMFVGFFVTALIFSKGLVITSWLILIIADPIAALVGTKVGKQTIYGKSLEGALAFCAAAIFIGMICYFFIGYNTSFLVLLLSSCATAAAEYYEKLINIDDNLLIPIVYSVSTVILNFIINL